MFWDVFFTDQDPDPYFSGSDPYFWPIRTQTQKKKSDPDPKKQTRIRNSGLQDLGLKVRAAQKRGRSTTLALTILTWRNLIVVVLTWLGLDWPNFIWLDCADFNFLLDLIWTALTRHEIAWMTRLDLTWKTFTELDLTWLETVISEKSAYFPEEFCMSLSRELAFQSRSSDSLSIRPYTWI